MSSRPAGADRAALALVVLAVAGAVAGMAAVSAGAVPQPALAEPVWYVVVVGSVGYWLAFVWWTRG